LPSGDLWTNIEKLSQALKNSSKEQSLGLATELACLQFLESKQYQILYHRFKTFYAEVDIVSIDRSLTLHLIEVKSSEPQYFFETRQCKRLQRLQDRLLEQELDVELSICYPKAGKLGIYPLVP
jgi:Holliday junction resolvase-like predicted endonuclease